MINQLSERKKKSEYIQQYEKKWLVAALQNTIRKNQQVICVTG